MSYDERERDEDSGPRRPRVVDKRVSARSQTPPPPPPAGAVGEAPVAATPPPVPQPPPSPEARDEGATEARAPIDTPAPEASVAKEAAPEELWTPEQEAEVQRMVEEYFRVPARDWIAESAIRLAQVAGVKIEGGAFGEGQLAIDALAALVNACGGRLGEAESPLRQTLAQLQLAFAQGVSVPPPA